MQPDSSGGGLKRFRSTPASWIESFILKEEEQDEIQQQENFSFTQLLSNNAAAAPSTSDSQPYLPDYYQYSSPHTSAAAANVSNNTFTQVLLFLTITFQLSVSFICNCIC